MTELVREAQGGVARGERRNVVPLSFEATVVPLPAEGEVRNNTAGFLVRATTSKRKVLLLDGRPAGRLNKAHLCATPAGAWCADNVKVSLTSGHTYRFQLIGSDRDGRHLMSNVVEYRQP